MYSWESKAYLHRQETQKHHIIIQESVEDKTYSSVETLKNTFVILFIVMVVTDVLPWIRKISLLMVTSQGVYKFNL